MKRRFWSLMIVLALSVTMAQAPQMMPQQAYAAANYGSTELSDYALEVTRIVNRERAANGLSPLQYSDRLSEAALVRAAEIQSSFSHTRPNGTSCFTALTESGITYTTAGENIAYGQRSPEEVMDAWMNSSGHRANILGKNYEYIGIGVTYRNGTYYWSQFFAASNDLTGEVPASTTTAPTAKPTTTTTAASSKPAVQTTATTAASTKPAAQTTATTVTTTGTTETTAATTGQTTATTPAEIVFDQESCRDNETLIRTLTRMLAEKLLKHTENCQ